MALAAFAAPGSFTFSHSDLTQEPAVWGTRGAEPYDVAIRIARPELAGCRITGFAVPMFPDENVTDISVWISHDLTLENKVMVPDIVSVPAEIVNDMLTVEFPDPYTLTEDGVYVGYSFTVAATGNQATDKPVALTYGKNPDGFFLHTKRTQATWKDKSSEIGGISMISVTLEGDFPLVGATISTPDEMDVDFAAESYAIPITLINHGSDPVSSLTFSYSLLNEPIVIEYPEPIAMQPFMPIDMTVYVPDNLIGGEINIGELRLTEINGIPNLLADTDVRPISIFAYYEHQKPTRRTLVEEYTGLWCGWCPKGFVALERLAEEMPKHFVGVAFHNSDDMAIMTTSQYPSDAAGLPTAWADRVERLDPTYRNVLNCTDYRAFQFTPAAVETHAFFGYDDSRTVNMTAHVTFARPVLHDYRMFYYLLGDGLTDKSWQQTNYFSGRDINDYPDMEDFINAGEKVRGLTFNDVLLLASPVNGVAGSLPAAADIVPGEDIACEWSFSLDDIVSLSGYDLAAAAKSFKVVAGVLDMTTGEVVNVANARVGHVGVDASSSVEADVVATEYYDFAGRRLSAPARGAGIAVELLSDGSRRSVKTISGK